MEQVTKAILSASQLHHKLTGEPIDESFEKQIKMWGTGLFRIVVMGEIKKGKSSFINAFLGVKDLVPVASDIATSTVFKVHYGKEAGYRVFFEKSTGKAPMKITAAELASYGTENGNPGNAKQVDFIEVISPAPLLKTGIVLIDTPGLGGLFKEHKKITWNYVPKADAVFFVTDSVESPIGLEEIAHLRTVLNITPHLFFVQTKSSAVDKDAREARRKNNLDILSRAFNTPTHQIPYFVVDSLRKFSADDATSMKKLERSGYNELMAFVNSKLLNQKHRILATRSIQLATPLLDGLKNNIATRKATLAANTAEEQKIIKTKIEEAQKALYSWQREKMPQLRVEFEREIQKIQLECKKIIASLRPDGEMQEQFAQKVESAASKKDLLATVETINSNLPEYKSACFMAIKNHTIKRITEQLSKVGVYDETTELAIIANDIDEQQIRTVNKGSLERTEAALRIKSDKCEIAKVCVLGASPYVTVLCTIGALLGSAAPGIGTLIGSKVGLLIAGAFGSYKAIKSKNEQDLKAAKQHVLAAIRQTMGSMYAELASDMEQLLFEVKNEISTTVSRLLESRAKELERQCGEITKRGQLSIENVNEQKAALAQEENQLRSILKALTPWSTAKTKA